MEKCSMRVQSGYNAPAFDRAYRVRVIRYFKKMVREVPFNTIVVTGVSGLLMGPILAHTTRKSLLVVRRDGESTHSPERLEGTIGGRYLFVDDFICKGDTATRVHNEIPGAIWAGAFLWRHIIDSYLWEDVAKVKWLKGLPVWACGDGTYFGISGPFEELKV